MVFDRPPRIWGVTKRFLAAYLWTIGEINGNAMAAFTAKRRLPMSAVGAN